MCTSNTAMLRRRWWPRGSSGRALGAVVLALGVTACNGTTQAPTEDRSQDMTSGPPIKQRPGGPAAGSGSGAASASAAPGPRPRSQKTYPETFDGAASLPAVASAADVGANDGAQVRLVGTYTELDARMKQEPPPVYAGHVAIVLGDGSQVTLLPVWHKDALRPEDEIARLRGQQVEVVGTVFKRAPTDPRGGASPIGPAIFDVKSLRALP